VKKIIFLAMVSLFLFSDGATALTLEEGVEISPGESNQIAGQQP
jgi:3-oxoacyl-[acyl-carrier-protein] synthase III